MSGPLCSRCPPLDRNNRSPLRSAPPAPQLPFEVKHFAKLPIAAVLRSRTLSETRGFIKVLASDELAFADYRGNRQYITVGNLAENDRMFLLLLDYAAGTRLKIWGHGTVVENDPALLEQVRDPDYSAVVERVIRMHVAAWDTNCDSHIPKLVAEAA